MNLITGIDVTADALEAQKTRLDIVAQNIANAQTTRTAKGGPYQRQVVSFATELLRRSDDTSVQTVKVASITPDPTPGQQVYNPQHPDAGPDGMVTMPNVNPLDEMVDMMTASRSYQANLQVIQTGRSMFEQSLKIAEV